MKINDELYGVLNAVRLARVKYSAGVFTQTIDALMPRIEEVLAKAEKAKAPRLFMVIHTHGDGYCRDGKFLPTASTDDVSTHLYTTHQNLTQAQVIQRLGIQYNPRAEELVIREIPNIPEI